MPHEKRSDRYPQLGGFAYESAEEPAPIRTAVPQARDAERCLHARTTGCRWRHPGNEEPPAERAGLQFHDVKQRNLSCRICVGAGDAPLNSPLSFARRMGTAV